MPLILNRRGFLQAAAGALAATRLMQGGPASTRWAFLSDTHVPENPNDSYRGFHPVAQCKTAAQQVVSGKFDGYVVNGDIARTSGSKGDYQRFAEAAGELVEKGPLALTMGNHDDRDNARSALTKIAGESADVSGKLVSVLDAGPVRLILLDSLIQTNTTPGLLGKQQRDWLAGWLDAHTETSSIIFVHHTLQDRDTDLLDSDRFLNIVRPRKQVKAVFYGHSHEWKREVQEGLHLVNLPAVGYNFADTEPVGWVEAELRKGGAELTLHAFAGNRAKDGERTKLEWRG